MQEKNPGGDANLDARLTRHSDRMVDLSKRIDSISSTVNHLGEKTDARIADVCDSIAKLRSDVSGINSKSADAYRRASDAHVLANGLAEEIGAVEKRLDLAIRDIAAIRDDVGAVNDKIETAFARIAEIEDASREPLRLSGDMVEVPIENDEPHPIPVGEALRIPRSANRELSGFMVRHRVDGDGNVIHEVGRWYWTGFRDCSNVDDALEYADVLDRRWGGRFIT